MTGRRYRAIFESRNHMRTLVAVAETGSMTEAARILDTTQPAVSRVIASFEESVGAELFRRRGPGPRSLRLTTIGIIVAHQARTILREMDEAERAIYEARDIFDELDRKDERALASLDRGGAR